MKLVKQKLYCYVDETGQDTEGEFFLVSIVINEIKQLDELQGQLINIEQIIKKKQARWHGTKKEVKINYLQKLSELKGLRNSIYYSVYKNTKEYTALTSLAIAKAIHAKKSSNYTAQIVIDGLNDRERDRVRNELKKLEIKYNKIRGMKDEQSVFLRLSDAIAGLLRESYEKEEYALDWVKKFKQKKIITEA